MFNKSGLNDPIKFNWVGYMFDEPADDFLQLNVIF